MKSYSVLIIKAAEKQLAQLDAPIYQQIKSAILSLSENQDHRTLSK